MCSFAYEADCLITHKLHSHFLHSLPLSMCAGFKRLSGLHTPHQSDDLHKIIEQATQIMSMVDVIASQIQSDVE